jgi:hypothetical protein
MISPPMRPEAEGGMTRPERSVFANPARQHEAFSVFSKDPVPQKGPCWDFAKFPIYAPGQSSRLRLQRKLEVGSVNDPLEDEADRIAERVTRDTRQPMLRRKCAACDKEEQQLRRKTAHGPAANLQAPELVHDVLRSPARPLDASLRAFFEARFRQDFSGVRIHNDARAAASARSVGALAYTVGRDIVFGDGAYNGSTESGRRLLAHELVHVTQQGNGEGRLQRKPCRSGDECKVVSGDPAAARQDVAKESSDRAAAQAAAPAGSAQAAKAARLGERAIHLENLLKNHGIPLVPEIAGFFVDPAQPPAYLATTKCSLFRGGTPGTPPVLGEKFCGIVPVEIEDEAKNLDVTTPLTDKQRSHVASLLAVASHEMQHDIFDKAQAAGSIEELTRGSTAGGRLECTTQTAVAANTTVGDLLSEISALTAEFPVFFRNLANQSDPGAALESHEKFNAITSSESLSGAITRLRCTCPCDLVENFVYATVMFTTASWTRTEHLAFLRTMTRLLPDLWPTKLQVREPPQLPAPQQQPPAQATTTQQSTSP